VRFRPAGRIIAGLSLALALGSALGLSAASASPPSAGSATAGPPGTIATIAGTIGGPALATRVALQEPCGEVFARGYLYFADTGMTNDEVLRRISTRTDQLATVAGNAGEGSTADGGPATDGLPEEFCRAGVAVDHAGNLIFSQQGGNTSVPDGANLVRVVAASTGTFYGQAMLAGHVYPIAGGGTGLTDGGPAVDAELGAPGNLAVDSYGNVLFTVVHTVQVIAAADGTFYGVPMTAGDLYDVAGNGRGGYSGNRALAVQAAVSPAGIRIGRDGNLIIADAGNHLVRVVPNVTGAYYGQQMIAGHIYTIAGQYAPGERTAACGNTGSGGRPLDARFCAQGIAVDRAGNLLITGGGATWVAAQATGTFYGRPMRAGRIYQVIKPGTSGLPDDVSVDGAGNAVLTSPAPVFQLSAPGNSGAIYVLAQRSGRDFGRSMRAGKLYRVAGNGWIAYSGDGGPASRAQLGGYTGTSGLLGPIGGLGTDPHGNTVIADPANLRLRVIAARTGVFYRKHMVGGHIYAIAGNGLFSGKTRDSGPAADAEVDPVGLAIDQAGDFAVTGPVGDSGRGRLWLLPSHSGIRFGRKLTAGDVFVIGSCPGRCLKSPGQPAFDSAGNVLVNMQYAGPPNTGASDQVFVAAARTGNFYGRRMRAGQLYQLAGAGPIGNSGNGGPATRADVAFGPVAVDRNGNVLLGQGGAIRVIARRTGTYYGIPMRAGDIYSVVSDCCHSALAGIRTIAVDPAGNVIFDESDLAQPEVRMLAERTGTFYGVPVVAGHVYVIAGTGVAGFSGDGGPASAATLAQPGPIVVTPAGDLLIADLLRIRRITG
jgi:trimeric autotransporter adhesin